MSSEEKRSWIHGIIAILAYGVYLAIVLAGATRTPIAEVGYQIPLLASVGGAIVANIVLGVVTGVGIPRGAIHKDQRDREISVFGEKVGASMLVLGGVGALALAMLEVDWFWIANALYLGFVLSAILDSLARLSAYRTGMPRW